MRILLTSDPEIPVPPHLYGGIQRIIDTLVRKLVENGNSVGLLAHPESTAPAAQLYPWPGMASQRLFDTARNCAALAQAVGDFQPDIIHSFSRLAYLLPCLRSNLPKIMSYQRYPGARTVRWGQRLSRGSLQFTGCSKYICSVGSRGGGQWQCVYNFVELEKFAFTPAVATDAPLVFLSRIDRIKGAHNAIAAARLAGRRLIIAGNHAESGPEAEYFKGEILKQVDNKLIEYIGPVDDVEKNRLLGSAAAMILPIEWDEPFGIVVTEALACGTPVISSPRGALPEIIREGKDGFLVTSPSEAAAAIERIPLINRRDCRSRVENLFSADTVVRSYTHLYQRLIADQSSVETVNIHER